MAELATAPTPTTADVEVTEVTTSAERNQFIRVPWTTQAGDPNWVPPMLMDRRDFINPKKHPFYKHGAATLYLARRHGEIVGRILVSDDPRYNEVHETNLACFGMFESIDDESVAGALLDAAAAWAKGRGRTGIMGPIDYSTNYECGLLVDGFDTPPRVMMTHNPPYYGRLLESWGLTKAKDLYAWWITDAQEPPPKWRKVAERLGKRGGVTIRATRMKEFDAEVAKIKEIYNTAWEDNWGFVKMTDAEFDHLAKDLKMLVNPELALMAEVDGKPVGFSLALPDLNEALRISGINGKLFPFGLPIGALKLMSALKKVKTIRLVILGILPGYRRRGINELLILRTYDRGKALGFDACEMGWTLEDNDLINRPIEALGSKRYKTYRIYEKAI